ncbi:MAG: Single-stranded DNA-binding protein [Candidatus Hydrogenedentes bacterium ADurb.Bin101]|jgi:single-strand DNA-binding protein|nr:MAG: Single-stranded DNA-binding protein [Candidatus Hydrogenedentes bacterium ADurb.Bin101]HOC67943.1 single-stranded DNA-binding protein [Candidatus Hydrogenedentota bacterium]
MSDLRVPDLNRVLIAGRLTRDPELKYVGANNIPFCRMGLANTRYYKDKTTGDRREDTTFIDVTVWRAQAEFVGSRLRKGRPVLIEGSLTTNEWEDQATGQKKSKTSVTATRVTPLDWEDFSGGNARPAARTESEGPAHEGPREIEEPIPEDDIPF